MAQVRHLGHFPKNPHTGICVPTLDYVLEYITPEQFSDYYIETGKKIAMDIVWRVREWTLTATFAAPADWTESHSSNAKGITNEKRLVCSGFPYYRAAGSQEGQGGQFDIVLGDYVEDRPGIVRNDDHYFVYLVFSIEGGDTLPQPEIIEDAGIYPVFQWNLVSPISVTAKLSPSLWWPYDPGDGGGPIYDSATGQRLRAGVF